MMARVIRKAFTLTELIITLVILGIVALIATISWPGKKVHVTAQAERVANDIRYVRNLAVNHYARYRINFTSSTQYTLTTGDGGTTITHPATGDSTITLPSGVTLSISGLPNNYILFDSAGAPYVSSSTALSSKATVTLSGDGKTSTITIVPETGKVSVS